MKKFRIRILLVSLLFAPYFLFPTPAMAVGAAFGGVINLIVPCSCSGGFAVFYTPLYINSPIPTTGFLYYSSFSSLLYSWYNPITPTVWNLGKFTPGVQGCFIPTPPAGCAVFPTLGSIIYEGTSGI